VGTWQHVRAKKWFKFTWTIVKKTQAC
jgi:hypothetical protein